MRKPIKIMRPIDLIEHPEGGRFREVFKSAKTVSTQDGTTRSALTHIYFSLKPGEVSRFHRVTSDEIWNLYQGAGLNLYTWDGTIRPPEYITRLSYQQLLLSCNTSKYLAGSKANIRYSSCRLLSCTWL